MVAYKQLLPVRLIDWSLRDYGTATWVGGDPECEHTQAHKNGQATSTITGGQATNGHKYEPYREVCGKCGAVRKNGQLGLEALHDCLGWATGSPCGECFVCHMVAVFREVRRVLRDDGCLFLNLGDSYYASPAGKPSQKYIVEESVGDGAYARRYRNNHMGGTDAEADARRTTGWKIPGLKQKDMVGIPWRVALALQADGWWLRSDVIWSKPNPMPESVTDRPTKSHEYVFVLTKSARYFWDADAVREAQSPGTFERYGDNGKIPTYNKEGGSARKNDSFAKATPDAILPNGRNLRTVWDIATQPYSGAHYATYPEALVERCLKAATSERGCCPVCRKPWERVVDVNYTVNTRTGGSNNNWKVGNAKTFGDHPMTKMDKSVTTLGWRATCGHEAEPVPCIVFDPFAGSGTTLLVAKRMGLHGVGLDLSYTYLRENAWERVGMAQPVLL